MGPVSSSCREFPKGKRPQLIAEDPITFDVIWRRMHILKPLAVASLVGLAAASSEELPHDHQGKLSKYELGPPKIFLSGDDLAQLREGRPVMQAAQQAGSSARRMVMVQDIKTPHDVVMGCAAPRSFPPISCTSAPRPPNRPTAVGCHRPPRLTAPSPLSPGASSTSRSTTRW